MRRLTALDQQFLALENSRTYGHVDSPSILDRRRCSPGPPASGSLSARAEPAAPAWNLVISNVPGPQIPLYQAGARMDAHYPIRSSPTGWGSTSRS
jgi:WS/DGAT C-terminal domain